MGIPMEVSKCPSLEDIRKCDINSEQSFCETTFQTCKEQNYESEGEGWSYCHPETEMGEYGICECKDYWYNTKEKCANFSVGEKMRGCPDLDALRMCEPNRDVSWCPTKSKTCLGQDSDNVGKHVMLCDPNTQEAAHIHKDAIIAASSLATILVMSIGVMIGIYFFRRWLKKNTISYTELYGDSDEVVLNSHHNY